MDPLQAVVDEAFISALPETSVLGRDLFVKNEKDNQFYLNISGEDAGKLALPLQESIKKLEANSKTLLDEKVKAYERLKPWETLGKSADEIQQILTDGMNADIKVVEEKHKKSVESIKTEHQQNLKAKELEIEERDKKIEEIRGRYQLSIKTTMIESLKNKHGLNELGDDWLAARIAVVPESEGSEKYVARVVDRNGDPVFKAGSMMTPEQLVEDAKANKSLAGMFNAGVGGGSGASPQQFGGFGGSSIKVSASASKTDPSIYRKAKEIAEKEGKSIEWVD